MNKSILTDNIFLTLRSIIESRYMQSTTLKCWIFEVVCYAVVVVVVVVGSGGGGCKSYWPFNRQAFCVEQSSISSASKMMPYFLPGHQLCQKDVSISGTTCTHSPHIFTTKTAKDKSGMKTTVPAGSRLVKHIAAHSLLSLFYAAALLLMTPSYNHVGFVMVKERVHQKLVF